MTTFEQATTANKALHTRREFASAIFTGATHGIGLGTLRAFVKHISRPNAVVIGRDRFGFEPELDELKTSHPNATFTFLEYDLSLLANIDAVSKQLQQYVSAGGIDFVCMSQGYAPIEGRRYSSEGLDEAQVLFYYGRIRMVQNLLSSSFLSPGARVLSIMAGGKEGRIAENDLALDINYSLSTLRAHFATLETLSLDHFARHYPAMTFLHVFPGRVRTNLGERSVSAWWTKVLFRWIVDPILFWGGTSVEDCGERMLELAFRNDFADGMARGRCWALNFDGVESESMDLVQYRADRVVELKIWAWLENVFERVLDE